MLSNLKTLDIKIIIFQHSIDMKPHSYTTADIAAMSASRNVAN